jgi:hypothetical protein
VSADLVDHLVQPARGEDHGQADGSPREGPLAQPVRPGDHDGRLVDRGPRFGCAPRRAPASHFAARIDFLKDEVFEICGALALAEALLNRLGRHDEAAHLATVFEIVEGRLVVPLPPLVRYDPAAGSCS